MRTYLAIVALCGSLAHAGDVTFATSDSISDGDIYDAVYIVDSPPQQTVVDMTGGFAAEVLPQGYSAFEMTGGVAMYIMAQDSSLLQLHGGANKTVVTKGDSTANVFDGYFGSMFLYAAEASTINVYGGHAAGHIFAAQNARLNLWSSATDRSLLTVRDDASVTLYGYGFVFDPSISEDKPYATLSGQWLDGSAFAFWVTEAETYAQIRLLPEPATILLLAFGGFCAMRRRACS